jgi:hypothetical protein
MNGLVKVMLVQVGQFVPPIPDLPAFSKKGPLVPVHVSFRVRVDFFPEILCHLVHLDIKGCPMVNTHWVMPVLVPQDMARFPLDRAVPDHALDRREKVKVGLPRVKIVLQVESA